MLEKMKVLPVFPTLKNSKKFLVVTRLEFVQIGDIFRFDKRWCRRDNQFWFSCKNGKFDYAEQIRGKKEKYVSVLRD